MEHQNNPRSVPGSEEAVAVPLRLRVLMVCTGNICRSPLAEHLLRDRLGDLASVRSAGTRGLDAWAMDPNSVVELERRGGDPTGFSSKRLTVADVDAADLILTMTTAHRADVLAERPLAMSRAFTLLEFAHLLEQHDGPFDPGGTVRELARRRGAATIDEYDIADPIGQSPQLHAAVAETIAGAVERIARGLGSPID